MEINSFWAFYHSSNYINILPQKILKVKGWLSRILDFPHKIRQNEMSDFFKETVYIYLFNQISWFFGKEAINYFTDCVLDLVKIMKMFGKHEFSEFFMVLASLVMS